MPSVRMKRSTKVLVVKGGSEGARVLRSGRRLWPDSDESKPGTTAGDHGEWSSDIGNSQGTYGASCFEGNGWHLRSGLKKQEVAPMKVDAELKPVERLNVKLESSSSAGRMWGSVYQRKRKRFSENRNGDSNKCRSSEDSMYGKSYVRRQLKKTMVRVGRSFLMLAAAVDSSRGEISWFVPFLGSVLGYMMRVRVRMRELSAFLLTSAVHDVFTSHGVHFSRVDACSGSGICKIFGMVQSGPLFYVDFSAVPSCFLYMQLNMLLRSRYLPLIVMETNTEMDTGNDEDNVGNYSSISSNPVSYGIKTLVSRKIDTGTRRVLIITPPKLDAWNSYHQRNSLNPFNVQTRRRSMRLTRARSSSSLSIYKANGSIVPSFVRTRSSCSPSSVISGRWLRNSSLKIYSPSNKELKASLVDAREDVYSTGCLANLLICEPDRCYREEGVSVMLEYSALRHWVIAVKRDGLVMCTHVAQNVMRPCASNRFTQAMIWTSEDGWKLEFINQWDWLNFTELFKECCDRNANTPTAKIIPVPGVCEVLGYDDIYSTPFIRPETYIRVDGDEVSRAMAKRTANYDIDSEDEEWLSKFNAVICKVSGHRVDVSVATLELMVDAFERAHFCCPDDYADVNAAVELCMDLERREVIEAVYRYWMRKRKQKHSALIRIFQCHHQPRKAQLIQKPVLRKKRSYKRQASQTGRGKHRATRGKQQLLALQVVTAEQDVLDEQSAMVRVEEAQRSASRSVELAIEKRKRAQMLTEFASLTMYRATMALRIAEGAPVMETMDAAVSVFFVEDVGGVFTAW